MANLCRLTLATAFLAIWAHTFGQGIGGASFPWFFLSGVVGFGLGDMALFGALTRIGPRLSILITQCLAAPIAAIGEWAWLGTTLGVADLVCAAVILGGVAIALAPDRGLKVERRVFWIGVLFGIGSALGQAFGAVISRKANVVAQASGILIDGGSAAYQRILGGVLVTALAFLLIKRLRPRPEEARVERWKSGWKLVTGNALAGPVIGVACYQWALSSTPSGIVLPIVATSPLVTLVLARWIDHEHPTRRAIVGGLIAVAGAVALKYYPALA